MIKIDDYNENAEMAESYEGKVADIQRMKEKWQNRPKELQPGDVNSILYRLFEGISIPIYDKERSFFIPDVYSDGVGCKLEILKKDDLNCVMLYTRGPVMMRREIAQKIEELEPGSVKRRGNRIGLNQTYKTFVGDFLRFDSVFIRYRETAELFLNELALFKAGRNSIKYEKSESDNFTAKVWETLNELFPGWKYDSNLFTTEYYPATNICDDTDYDYLLYHLSEGIDFQIYKQKNREFLENLFSLDTLYIYHNATENEPEIKNTIKECYEKFLQKIKAGSDAVREGMYYFKTQRYDERKEYGFYFRTEDAKAAVEFIKLLHNMMMDIKNEIVENSQTLKNVRLMY